MPDFFVCMCVYIYMCVYVMYICVHSQSSAQIIDRISIKFANKKVLSFFQIVCINQKLKTDFLNFPHSFF